MKKDIEEMIRAGEIEVKLKGITPYVKTGPIADKMKLHLVIGLDIEYVTQSKKAKKLILTGDIDPMEVIEMMLKLEI